MQSPCSLGSSGRRPSLKAEHSMAQVYHPDDKAEVFSKYLSKYGLQISLTPASCMCNKCYKDCKRYCDEVPGRDPRWKKINSEGLYTPWKHCAVCHYDILNYTPGNQTPCKKSQLDLMDIQLKQTMILDYVINNTWECIIHWKYKIKRIHLEEGIK